MNNDREREREVVRETREIRPEEGGGMGFLLGIILIIVLLVLFFVYGLPDNQEPQEPANDDTGVDIDVDLPPANGGDEVIPDNNTDGGDTDTI